MSAQTSRAPGAANGKVFIATPTAQGTVTAAFAQSLLAAASAFTKAGFAYRQAFFDGPDVSMARNAFAHAFLADPEATHLLFIDSDMQVGVDVFQKLLHARKPIAAAVYVERRLDLDRFVEAIRSGLTKPRALALASNFVMRVADGPLEVAQGFCRLEAVGFGCILIERAVFESLIAKGLAPRAKADKLARHGLAAELHDFFSEINDPGAGRLSEDYAFCRRARAAGFDIWGAADAAVGHIGQFAYSASLLDRLEAGAERLR